MRSPEASPPPYRNPRSVTGIPSSEGHPSDLRGRPALLGPSLISIEQGRHHGIFTGGRTGTSDDRLALADAGGREKFVLFSSKKKHDVFTIFPEFPPKRRSCVRPCRLGGGGKGARRAFGANKQ